VFLPLFADGKAMYKNPCRAAEAKAWGLLCSAVRRESELSAGQLERHFKVGDGSGRVWRAWMAGDRVARPGARDSIVAEAIRLGWTSLADARRLEALSNLAAPDVQSPRLLDFSPPSSPYDGPTTNARQAASRLMGWTMEFDQVRHPSLAVGTRGVRHLKQTMKLLKKEQAQGDDELSRAVDAWSDAAQKVHKLILKEGEEVVLERLRLAYVAQGYK